VISPRKAIYRDAVCGVALNAAELWVEILNYILTCVTGLPYGNGLESLPLGVMFVLIVPRK
ncbi:MAG: hypothetical protein IJY18_05625, partial [Clostridia bacterium]|nr:hypothetical protein [Clostridia bacterium]